MLLRHGGGGAAAFQTNRECFGKKIFDSNILLSFNKIKIRFSCVKIQTEVSCEATKYQVLVEHKKIFCFLSK